jgi:hypothetical protein
MAIVVFVEWRLGIVRACITPTSEDQSQKERLLIGGRTFGSSADEQAFSTKAYKALLFPCTHRHSSFLSPTRARSKLRS